MKKIIKRLKGKTGETLVESMAAILIFTFSSIIMLSMVSSAADINTAAKKADQEYFEDMVIIELAETPTGTNTVSFSILPSGSVSPISGSASVDVYSGTNGMYAYYLSGSSPEGGGPA